MDISIFLTSGMAILIGLFVGMLMGALPGLGLMLAISLLLPLSYNMEALPSILMLLGVYQGAEYGGSISAILLGIPGTAMAAATQLDGQPFAQNKSPGKALAYSLTASTIGGLFGGLVLIFLSKPLTAFALKLGEPEYFMLGVIGLLAVAALGSADSVKASISIILGLMAATVGIDMFTGMPRFTGGVLAMSDGINIIALVVALFAFTEIFSMISGDLNKKRKLLSKELKVKLSFKELREVAKPIGIGSLMGAVVGIIPGLGSNASSWFAYMAAKKTAKDPLSFGKGNPDGIAAPESANNATVGGALLPLLTLGIPGSASIAIIAGAFIIHGIQPGPQVLKNNPELINAIFIGFMFTTVGMYIMGKFMTSLFARILVLRESFLVPAILVFSLIGVYTSQNSHFDLWLALVLGVIAYVLRLLDFSVAYFILAFVLCPIIETSMRRMIILAQGDISFYFGRPIFVVLAAVVAVILLVALKNTLKDRKLAKLTHRREAEGESVHQ
ncbi:tripartite tricarboxylate transporter permease [Sporosarcina sp. P1]|uniref:tripartite tricarboxylate transporter permease n=1 Tax=Sporosarcina sp. P1 TaxID=2048257 RepID=UPI000C166E96|nr:tripartite tricarboxylate transporter permease [Sporosarcina sp. P1]PIC83003.1 hypothetical protein CSV73_09770 [Sporosarcina sp. P1]